MIKIRYKLSNGMIFERPYHVSQGHLATYWNSKDYEVVSDNELELGTVLFQCDRMYGPVERVTIQPVIKRKTLRLLKRSFLGKLWVSFTRIFNA